MGDTPCVKMLEEAITVCNKGASPNVAAGLSGADKVSQRYTRKNAPSFAATLQGFVLREIPIFNILEAMCWIYTCCVHTDEILTDRETECLPLSTSYLRSVESYQVVTQRSHSLHSCCCMESAI